MKKLLHSATLMRGYTSELWHFKNSDICYVSNTYLKHCHIIVDFVWWPFMVCLKSHNPYHPRAPIWKRLLIRCTFHWPSGYWKSDSILTSLGCSKMHGLMSDSSRLCWATALVSLLLCPCLPHQLGSLSLWQVATQPFPKPLHQLPPISLPSSPKQPCYAHT